MWEWDEFLLWEGHVVLQQDLESVNEDKGGGIVLGSDADDKPKEVLGGGSNNSGAGESDGEHKLDWVVANNGEELDDDILAHKGHGAL